MIAKYILRLVMPQEFEKPLKEIAKSQKRSVTFIICDLIEQELKRKGYIE